MGEDLQKMYDVRFDANKKREKSKIWGEICSYFEKYLPRERGTVVDIAAGYCDFINHVKADRKIAIDLNPDVKRYAEDDVEAIVDDILNLGSYVEEGTVSVFFMSNFLEHIPKETISRLIQLQYKLLKPHGELWILTPNIRYTKGKYWDFYDHITPLTEKALIERCEMEGYALKRCIPKFLPYTTKSKLPQSAWLVRAYLSLMPFSGYFLGEQSLIILEKRE